MKLRSVLVAVLMFIFAGPAMAYDFFNPLFEQIAHFADGPVWMEAAVGEQMSNGAYRMIPVKLTGSFRLQDLREALSNTVLNIQDQSNLSEAQRLGMTSDMTAQLVLLDQLLSRGMNTVTLTSETPIFDQLQKLLQ